MSTLERPANKLLTLVFLLRSQPVPQVLLGFKKRGFAEGRWNGFGGKVEANETIIQAAVREMKEESGADLSVEHLNRAGILMFEFVGNPQIWEVHVFRTTHYTGDIIETEEMRPQWFKHNEIPWNDMWPDDKLWYPYLFENKYFEGYFKFDGMDIIVEQRLTETTPTNTGTILM